MLSKWIEKLLFGVKPNDHTLTAVVAASPLYRWRRVTCRHGARRASIRRRCDPSSEDLEPE
jgi:hypothetical protein